MDGTKIMGRPCKVDYESITEYMANLKKPEGCTAVQFTEDEETGKFDGKVFIDFKETDTTDKVVTMTGTEVI